MAITLAALQAQYPDLQEKYIRWQMKRQKIEKQIQFCLEDKYYALFTELPKIIGKHLLPFTQEEMNELLNYYDFRKNIIDSEGIKEYFKQEFDFTLNNEQNEKLWGVVKMIFS